MEGITRNRLTHSPGAGLCMCACSRALCVSRSFGKDAKTDKCHFCRVALLVGLLTKNAAFTNRRIFSAACQVFET